MNYKQRMALDAELQDLKALVFVDGRGARFSTVEYAITRWPEEYALGRTHPKVGEARAYLLSSPYVYGRGDSEWQVAIAAVRARLVMLSDLQKLVADDRARLDTAGEALVRGAVIELPSLLKLGAAPFPEAAYTFPPGQAVRKLKNGDQVPSKDHARHSPYVARSSVKAGSLVVRRTVVRDQLASARAILRLVERRSRTETMVLLVRVEYRMTVESRWYKGRQVPEKVEAENVRESLVLSNLEIPEDTLITVTREQP